MRRRSRPCRWFRSPAARGVWLYDFDGRRYLDGISSWWVNLFGHCHPRINAALREQLDELEHVILAGCTHRPVVELSERLSAFAGGMLGHCFYASDGASATEIALKMSFHSWQNRGRQDKQEFLCLAGSYHGETIGALAVTDVALFKDAYAPLIRPASTVPTPDARLAEAGKPRSRSPAARPPHSKPSRTTPSAHRRADRRAADPVRQRHGDVRSGIPAPGAPLCDRYQVHLICDEIAVGCGRTGTFFAHQQAAIQPGLPLPVERHLRRLPAAVDRDDQRCGLRGFL
jgi:adenosylmethionine-8-amino-7-oxononanoate aminotransferase